MKKHSAVLMMSTIAVLVLYMNCVAQNASTPSTQSTSGTHGWTIKEPFKSEVFIKNNGQFNSVPGRLLDNVQYAVINGGLKVYFTPSGLSYYVPNAALNPRNGEEKEEIFEKMERQMERNGRLDESLNKYFTDKSAFVNIQWEGANPDAHISVSEQVPDNYSYLVKNEKGEYFSVLANAYKKLTYQNIYPNIDIEYYFPINNDKLGVEYNVVVHPGGDLAIVKMKYSGMQSISMDMNGNIMLAIPDGNITEHAPALSFVGNKANQIKAKFALQGQTVSFNVPGYDKTQTLVIDPFVSVWSISPGFTTANDGYTLRMDYYHNVYVMGGGVNMGGFPFTRWDYQVKKFNSAGTLQWTAVVSSPNGGAYGDMVVLPSGKAIVGHAFGAPGAVSLLNPATGAITSRPTAGANEPGWRFSYNSALNNNIVFMGGGSNNGAHLYKTDTNITAVSLNNPWTTAGHTEDICYLAQDKSSSFVYVTNTSNSNPNSSPTALKFCKASVATPGTPIWKVNEPTNMMELGQGSYINGGAAALFGHWATGVNGMVVCDNYIYTYNGSDLRAYDPTNGSIFTSTTSGGTFDKCSGIDADKCCRIYVGVNGVVNRYTSTLAFDVSIPVTSDVYDLQLDPLDNTTMYVTGKGFVQRIDSLGPCATALPPVAHFTSSDTTFCNEGGECIDFTDHSTNNPTTWTWTFPGAQPDTSTMQNPTSICYYIPGTYPVTLLVTNAGGTDSLKVSSHIIFGSGAALPTITQNGTTLTCSHEAAYQWYFNGSPIPGATDSFYVATQSGNYSVYITDDIGCSRLSNSVTITVDVNDVAGGHQLEIYPNPAKNQITIYGLEFIKDGRLDIFNVLGEKVYDSKPETANPRQGIVIDISMFAKGVYVVELTNGGRIYRAKVMKE